MPIRTRRVVGMSIGAFFLRFLFIVVLAGTLMYLLNRDTANTYFAQFGAPTGSNVNGTWVGVLDSYNGRMVSGQLQLDSDSGEPGLPGIHAVMLLNMNVSNAFMGSYRGNGLFYTQGNPDLRTLDDVKFDIVNGVLDGEVFTFRNPQTSGVYQGSQGIKGTFNNGTIELTSMDFTGHGFRGKLHHGDKAEYLKLCQALGLSTAK
jgi:hypothetical protein